MPAKGRKNTRSASNLNSSHIDQNQTPTKSSSPENSDSYEELLHLVTKLTKKVHKLEGEVCILRSEIAISSTVNTTLREKLDDLEQYSRRSCILVDGIEPKAKESTRDLKSKIRQLVTRPEDPEDLGDNPPITTAQFDAEFDKCHRVGPVIDGKQSAIVKFKSHGFRELIYRRRKSLTKRTGNKIRVSLTRNRTKLLAKANELAKPVDRVKFPFADVDGNLCLLLNKPFRSRWKIPFTSEEDLQMKLCQLEDEGDGYYTDVTCYNINSD